jgi:hypothetical protein
MSLDATSTCVGNLPNACATRRASLVDAKRAAILRRFPGGGVLNHGSWTIVGTIAVAVIGTFGMMMVLGMSINTLTLFGLVLQGRQDLLLPGINGSHEATVP